MTVKELIELLNEYPGDLEVNIISWFFPNVLTGIGGTLQTDNDNLIIYDENVEREELLELL